MIFNNISNRRSYKYKNEFVIFDFIKNWNYIPTPKCIKDTFDCSKSTARNASILKINYHKRLDDAVWRVFSLTVKTKESRLKTLPIDPIEMARNSIILV